MPILNRKRKHGASDETESAVANFDDRRAQENHSKRRKRDYALERLKVNRAKRDLESAARKEEDCVYVNVDLKQHRAARVFVECVPEDEAQSTTKGDYHLYNGYNQLKARRCAQENAEREEKQRALIERIKAGLKKQAENPLLKVKPIKIFQVVKCLKRSDDGIASRHRERLVSPDKTSFESLPKFHRALARNPVEQNTYTSWKSQPDKDFLADERPLTAYLDAVPEDFKLDLRSGEFVPKADARRCYCIVNEPMKAEPDEPRMDSNKPGLMKGKGLRRSVKDKYLIARDRRGYEIAVKAMQLKAAALKVFDADQVRRQTSKSYNQAKLAAKNTAERPRGAGSPSKKAAQGPSTRNIGGEKKVRLATTTAKPSGSQKQGRSRAAASSKRNGRRIDADNAYGRR
ncbi:hypothetical protein BDV96DRAFT_655904 [Lophiotrema nucula]|uniref:Uncharacterized protein n=1 Tax=Lophiotrema nucula TaxID=690887 RepID=A0A6A5YDK9_9PLEO|nr:hypothetical protein BDV96DRAFT_655904 [Lophiotrema nucula]